MMQHDNIGKKVLCWVWDSDIDRKEIRLITHSNENINPYKYISEGGEPFKNAKPMLPEEVEKYILRGEE